VERVVTGEPIPTRAGLAHFLRIRLERGPAGLRSARLTGPQGSGILTSVSRADALLVVPEDLNGLPAGVEADALPLDRPLAGQAELGYTTNAGAAKAHTR
jgi:molybdopterin molybdotransferase